MASARDRHLAKAASEIAIDLQGPAGQITLDRVVRRHLRFQDAQDRWLSWRQLARLLHSASAGREGGQPFSHGHLSAVVWRQREKAKRLSSGEQTTVAATLRAAPETVLAEAGSMSGSRPAKSKTKKPAFMAASDTSRAGTPAEDVLSINSGVSRHAERVELSDVACRSVRC